MKFKEFLNEEPYLEPNLRKEFKDIGAKAKYKTRYENIFPKGQDRIYIPIEGPHTTKVDMDLEDKINNEINNFVHRLEDDELDLDYAEGKADFNNGVANFTIRYYGNKLPKKISLSWMNYGRQ